MRDISFDHQIHSLRADLLRTEYAFLLLQQAMMLKHRHHHKADSDETATSHYVWVTAGDDKVRPSHAANDGMIFAWSDPPSTGHPGEEANCRCSAEPYDGNDAIEPVYPELLLIPLLRVGRGSLAAAIRAIRWISKSSNVKKHEGFTDHGALRSRQRSISSEDANTAIQTATAAGKVTTKIGKYGTRQFEYEGTNGVTVVIETEGRNAGKVITFWYNR